MKPNTFVDDPNMKLPPAVAAVAARSAEAFRLANNIQPDDAGGEEDNGEGTPEKTPEAPQTTSKDAPSPAETPSNGQGSPGEEENWEHRYRSMKGRYDRVEEHNRQLSSRVTQLESMLATMSAPPKEQTPPELQPKRLITPEEEESYGSEFLGVVGKKAEEIIAAREAAFQQRISQLEARLGQVQGTVVSSKRDELLRTLADQVPNWEAMNADPDFLAWLRLPDTYSGTIRHELLKAAFERNDAPRVVAFFKGFLAEEAAVDPAKGQPNPKGQEQAPPASQKKVPLEQFAAPGRAKSAASSVPAEKPIITRAQIASFYTDKSAGRYRGREAEAQQAEKMIFEAQRDGRIR